MAWLGQFKLGRPAQESTFEINPAAWDSEDQLIADDSRGLDGTRNRTVMSFNRPSVRLRGNYITPNMWNKLRSLMQIADTPLIFEPMTTSGQQVWEDWLIRVTPATLTTIVLPATSFTRGDQLRFAASGAALLTVLGVFTGYAADGATGTGSQAVASLDRSTSTITLSASLADLSPVFVSLRATGLACDVDRVPARIEAGWVDALRYDLEIVGA
jgi:hypothetical protein